MNKRGGISLTLSGAGSKHRFLAVGIDFRWGEIALLLPPGLPSHRVWPPSLFNLTYPNLTFHSPIKIYAHYQQPSVSRLLIVSIDFRGREIALLAAAPGPLVCLATAPLGPLALLT